MLKSDLKLMSEDEYMKLFQSVMDNADTPSQKLALLELYKIHLRINEDKTLNAVFCECEENK